MKEVFYGVHFYININNLNAIIKKDEQKNDDLGRTFHALNTFIASMEKFASDYNDVEVEKFTTSRLHFYIPMADDAEIITAEMLEIVAFANRLAKFINTFSKYQSLVDFRIGAGADFGKYTEFNFKDADSGIEEMTTIGSPANHAAKIQSLCPDSKILISKEVFELLPSIMKASFLVEDSATLKLKRKYSGMTAYGAFVSTINAKLSDDYKAREKRNLEYASDVANKLNLGDIKISDARVQLDFSNLSLKNTKKIENSAILFSDIRGFTHKVDESNLSEMKQLTKNVLEMMNKEVRNRDGVHVQFQGDRESAVFNQYDSEKNNFALRAVLCAMRMLDKLDEINKNRDDHLNIGIGCAFGTTFANRIGMKEKKFNVTMGETVKEADEAEDNVAGTNISGADTEIAITDSLYQYLIKLDSKTAEYIKDAFSQKRTENNKTYHISTMRFSEYQKKALNNSMTQNAERAKSNGGLKPWSPSNDNSRT